MYDATNPTSIVSNTNEQEQQQKQEEEVTTNNDYYLVQFVSFTTSVDLFLLLVHLDEY